MSLVQSTDEVYIIAEIGQNHNGDIEIAKKIVDQLDNYPYDEFLGQRWRKCNAIKLTKRDLEEELSLEGMSRPYNSPNSFGKTYGEHREFLELSYEQHVELGKYIKSKGFEFVQTFCSIKTLKLLDLVDVDKIKIASRDLTNIPLLKAVADRPQPVILSTGMADKEDLDNALAILENGKNKSISILHCISQYPAMYSNLNLDTIRYLHNRYGDKYTIGYSDHSIGTHIPVTSVGMGAKILEKHVTLDTSMKGSDHKGSADISTFNKMVHDIRSVEFSKGSYSFFRDETVKTAKDKLERSLAYNKNLIKGTVLTEEDIHMISPGTGLKWNEVTNLVGKSLSKSVEKNTLISLADYEKP